MTIGRHLLTLVAGLPLLLAGCADDPSPQIAPPEPSASTTLLSPQPKEPWQKKSKAGAVAFAEHWVEVFNEAQETGEVDELRAISDSGCGTCTGVMEQIEGLYGSDGHLISKGWKVRSSTAIEQVPTPRSRVALRIHRAAQVVVLGEDAKRKRYPASEVTMSARLAWGPRGWVMQDLVAVQ